MSGENTKDGEKFRCVEAMDGDPSIWATAAVPLSYQNNYGQLKKVSLPHGVPRGYLRIIPADWEKDIPHPRDIKNLPVQRSVRAVESNASGRCEEGFVDLRIVEGTEKLDGKEPPVSDNVAMWFEKTGEYWVIQGSAIGSGSLEKKLPPPLRYESLIKGWDQALRAVIKVLNSLGALPKRRVEAGVAGIMGVGFPDNPAGDWPESFKNATSVSHQPDNWDDEAQRDFLNDAFNKIRDCFDLPPLNRADFEKLTGLKPIAN